MDEARKKAQVTRKRNEQIRQERYEQEKAEAKAQAAALRQIRDSQEATPGERLEAVKMLEELKGKYVII